MEMEESTIGKWSEMGILNSIMFDVGGRVVARSKVKNSIQNRALCSLWRIPSWWLIVVVFVAVCMFKAWFLVCSLFVHIDMSLLSFLPS
jgi:predicted CDP-diglyceride synthetase/phosphatidate cytidylyltransferase